MKEAVKITLVLSSVCVFCGFLLAVVHGLAEERIETNARMRIEKAISNLAPDKHTLEEIIVGQDRIYKLRNKNNKLIGYAFSAEGQGYQGKIKILAVINPSLTELVGIEIVESLETPGLGAKIADKPFKEQFKGLEVSALGQVQAITGATVSSKAVVHILNRRIKLLQEQLKPQ